MTGGPASRINGSSVAKVQTKIGRMNVADTGPVVKYDRK
jgi:hypothetical protein